MNVYQSKMKTLSENPMSNVADLQNLPLGNVHKGCPTIMGNFGHTYIPMSDVFYTMPITLVRFLLRYLPTPKFDILYESSLKLDIFQNSKAITSCFMKRIWELFRIDLKSLKPPKTLLFNMSSKVQTRLITHCDQVH